MDIEKAKRLLSQSQRVCALTGAGISVDSGIPDFRSEGGLWARYDPHEYATYDSFLRDPTKFWTMGRELAEVLISAEPNAAHLSLAKMEEEGKLIGVITQNIDNLHQVAGNKNVVELHGNYLRAYCMDCEREYVGEEIHRRVASGEVPPKCDHCGGVLKSEAVLFGEPLPEKAMGAAIRLCKKADLMLVVGTSLTIYPAAYLPQLAKDFGAKVVLVSLEGVDRDGVADCVVKGRASEILPKIL
ncbi:MAG: NAD-dependent deacylase [Candidatus Thorarchaeota archaeon]|nr:MAG: NAD-dependent deacylase [Candidatus Thorarchaeota archaeon]